MPLFAVEQGAIVAIVRSPSSFVVALFITFAVEQGAIMAIVRSPLFVVAPFITVVELLFAMELFVNYCQSQTVSSIFSVYLLGNTKKTNIGWLHSQTVSSIFSVYLLGNSKKTNIGWLHRLYLIGFLMGGVMSGAIGEWAVAR